MSDVVMLCGKHGCSDQAVCRVRVVSALMRTQYVACVIHVSEFGSQLKEMLRLPQADEWRISIESLGWTATQKWAHPRGR